MLVFVWEKDLRQCQQRYYANQWSDNLQTPKDCLVVWTGWRGERRGSFRTEAPRIIPAKTCHIPVNMDEWYIIQCIILEGIPIRYEILILAHISDISFNISLSNMKFPSPIRIQYPILRILGGMDYGYWLMQ